MAIPEERMVASACVSETSQLNGEVDLSEECEEYYEGMGRGCLRGLCLFETCQGPGRYLLLRRREQQAAIGEGWLRGSLKRTKEFSEVVAGPKWKTFIRRLSSIVKKKRSSSKMQFQYDPQSYQLNFDDGINGGVDDLQFDHFSARYACPVDLVPLGSTTE